MLLVAFHSLSSVMMDDMSAMEMVMEFWSWSWSSECGFGSALNDSHKLIGQ